MDLYDEEGAFVDPHTIGRWGEALAKEWLKRQGYKILYQNFRSSRGGEVDIICRHRETLVFVEVKTRTSTRRGLPREAVDRQKQRYILKAASYWISKLENPEKVPVRCDVVEVILEQGKRPRLQNIEGALEWRGRS